MGDTDTGLIDRIRARLAAVNFLKKAEPPPVVVPLPLPIAPEVQIPEESKEVQRTRSFLDDVAAALFRSVNRDIRAGKKQLVKDEQFMKARLYDCICDELEKSGRADDIRHVEMEATHSLLTPAKMEEELPLPTTSFICNFSKCKVAVEVKRVTDKFKGEFQSIRDAFAKMAYFVAHKGCDIGYVFAYGTVGDFSRFDLSHRCVPMTGEFGELDVILSRDTRIIRQFARHGLKTIPWCFRKEMRANLVPEKEKFGVFCVRLYSVRATSRGQQFSENTSDSERLANVYAQKLDLAPSLIFNAEDARREIERVDEHVQARVYTVDKAVSQYAGVLDMLDQGTSFPGQEEDFAFLGKLLRHRLRMASSGFRTPRRLSVVSELSAPPSEIAPDPETGEETGRDTDGDFSSGGEEGEEDDPELFRTKSVRSLAVEPTHGILKKDDGTQRLKRTKSVTLILPAYMEEALANPEGMIAAPEPDSGSEEEEEDPKEKKKSKKKAPKIEVPGFSKKRTPYGQDLMGYRRSEERKTKTYLKQNYNKKRRPKGWHRYSSDEKRVAWGPARPRIIQGELFMKHFRKALY
ncbi:uncharacterized protein [Branchiostoma lanceolatum]|uniref:uncharacterized protein isoform X1 n=2 Tax=Branchiostoma lanceolatum TaxID=7740 RepID=UPI003454FD2B